MLFGRARLCAGTVFVCAIALMCPAAASAAPHRVADGKIGDWLGTTSGYGGTSQYSHGEFIYQDYIFDDLGAETNSRSQQHGTFSPPSGDYRYPTDEKRYGYNAADLLELRLAADRDSLWILARMNTLKVPDSTVVAVAFDTDRRSTTGGGEWPFGAGLKVAGVDRVVTLWGTGGAITRLPSGATAPLRDVGVDTANDDNAIEARVPRGLLGGGPVLRVWAATGLWDPSTRQWMPVPSGDPTATHPGGGSATVPARAFNVAFRPNESGSYMEEGQAAALANGDISALHADVDLRLLLSGATRPFKVVPGRFYTVVMDQNLTIPPYNEGLSYSGIPGRFSGVRAASHSRSTSTSTAATNRTVSTSRRHTAGGARSPPHSSSTASAVATARTTASPDSFATWARETARRASRLCSSSLRSRAGAASTPTGARRTRWTS
jgi:hypothetical protein